MSWNRKFNFIRKIYFKCKDESLEIHMALASEMPCNFYRLFFHTNSIYKYNHCKLQKWHLPEFDPSLWCNELVLLVLWSARAVLLLLFSLFCIWAAILLLAPPTPMPPFTPGWWSWSCLHSSVSSRKANSSPGMSCLLHALHLKHSMW